MMNQSLAGYGICPVNPNPSTIFGVGCFNGVSNATMVFNVTGYENTQTFYKFLFNSFGNGTLAIIFIGAVPGQVVDDAKLIQSNNYAAGKETIIDSGSTGAGVLCIVYTGSCGGPSGGGGGGGGGGDKGPLSGVSTIFNQVGGVNVAVAAIVIFVLLILGAGIFAASRRDKREGRR
jgi:hypothetical protein